MSLHLNGLMWTSLFPAFVHFQGLTLATRQHLLTVEFGLITTPKNLQDTGHFLLVLKAL